MGFTFQLLQLVPVLSYIPILLTGDNGRTEPQMRALQYSDTGEAVENNCVCCMLIEPAPSVSEGTPWGSFGNHIWAS